MKCLKCQRPVEAHERWTAENIKAYNVSPKCIGQFIGHDPLTGRANSLTLAGRGGPTTRDS